MNGLLSRKSTKSLQFVLLNWSGVMLVPVFGVTLKSSRGGGSGGLRRLRGVLLDYYDEDGVTLSEMLEEYGGSSIHR